MADKKVFLSRQRWVLLGAGLCITLCSFILYIVQPSILQQGDRQIYDMFLRASGGGKPAAAPAIVDIDEASLRQYGQWPWPRHLMARLIKKLAESGAASIGLDIMLAEPDRSSPLRLQESLREGFGVDLGFTGLPDFLKDNDILLANVMRQTPIVLGFYVQFERKDFTPLPKNLPRNEGLMERVPKNAISPRKSIVQGTGVTLPLTVLLEAAPIGMLNVAPDADGIVRAIPLVLMVGDRIFPTLGLRALMRAFDTKNLVLESGSDGLRAVYMGKYRIPVTPSGLFYIPFRGPRGMYPYFSAKDILDGKVPDSELAGRVLLVGTSAPGLLDIRATPFDQIYPGVESHAAVVDAILSKRSIEMPAWIPGAQMFIVLLMGIMATLAFGFAPALVYVPLLLTLSAGSIGIAWYIFQKGMFISPLYALVTVVTLMISLLGVRFWQESQQKRQLRKAFSRYVSPEMVNRIADRGEAVLAGEEREITLIFTDIRGFTSLSEKLEPAQVVAVLNRYFTPMTGLIHKTHGTVDKFIGDAIMAFWNAPLDVPGHELKAVQTAMAMHIALDKLNIELEAEYDVHLAIGVGVHTGKVYVGNMGSEELLDYTCIGDTVNLSSRLEGLCPQYGVGIVVSTTTAEHCVAFAATTEKAGELPIFVELDAIRVKGKTEPIGICTPITAEEAEERSTELADFALAREVYVLGDFAKATKSFAVLKAAYPDVLLYSIYSERCENLLQDPPEDWNGVWTFTKK